MELNGTFQVVFHHLLTQMKNRVEARCARLLREVTAGVSSSDLAGIMHWKGEEIS